MECEYCKRVLSCKSSLNYHIKTNKKCKKLRDISTSTDLLENLYICSGCDKSFTTVYNLKIHTNTCNALIKVNVSDDKLFKANTSLSEIKNKLEEVEIDNEYYKAEIEKLKIEHMVELQNQTNMLQQKEVELCEKDTCIAELNAKIELYKEFSNSSKGVSTNTVNNTVTTNNNVNNIIVSSLDIMEDPTKLNRLIEQYYSTDYFIEGQIGVAKFSNDHLVTDEKGNKLYICTDTSRNSFKYKNAKGDIVKDPHGNKFAGNLLDNGLKDMARKHSNALLAKDHDFTNVTSKFFEIDDMCKDTKKFCKHLGSLVAI
jgi:hypothetical protein